ncbi:MAG: DNA-binding protein YbiB [Zoogloeaceae bacterium]|jgi:anthranilate phosphoribosyltransferase|nr:DNA-binding protein YbiB [Zoogloeaceae bacterium]
MNFAHYVREIARGNTLLSDEAEKFYSAILDGGVPDLELGATLLALRMRGESAGELDGFLTAVEARACPLARPEREIRPVVLPSYNGARKSANLTPLLALLLRRFGVPTLVHGLLESFGRVTSAHVFRELDIMPVSNAGDAQRQIDQQGLAFVPLPALAPGLASQLSLRARLGVRSCAHSLAKLFDPFRGEGILLAQATHPAFLEHMRNILMTRERRAILFRGTEGEPYANPLRRPALELIRDGGCRILFEAEHESIKSLPYLPESTDARTTAQWMRQVLEDNLPLPLPLAHQLACCLYASGVARDVNEAKALVAVEIKASLASGRESNKPK